MLCPDCRKTMKTNSKQVMTSMSFIDGESIFETVYFNECTCGIRYEDLKWEIPEDRKASEKQIKAAMFIENVLKIKAPPPTKKGMWVFINNYFDKAKEKQETKNNDSKPEDEDSYYPSVFDFGFDDNLPF